MTPCKKTGVVLVLFSRSRLLYVFAPTRNVSLSFSLFFFHVTDCRLLYSKREGTGPRCGVRSWVLFSFSVDVVNGLPCEKCIDLCCCQAEVFLEKLTSGGRLPGGGALPPRTPPHTHGVELKNAQTLKLVHGLLGAKEGVHPVGSG